MLRLLMSVNRSGVRRWRPQDVAHLLKAMTAMTTDPNSKVIAD